MRLPEFRTLRKRDLAATGEDLVRQQPLQPSGVALKAPPDLILKLHAERRSESALRRPALICRAPAPLGYTLINAQDHGTFLQGSIYACAWRCMHGAILPRVDALTETQRLREILSGRGEPTAAAP